MKPVRSIDILLVEDNPNDIELTMRAFKQNQLQYNIEVVRNGEEALDYLFCKNQYKNRDINDQPKVILLDLKLPKVTGNEVLGKIKKNAKTKMIPVVVLTTSKEHNDIMKSYDLGVNSYIVKPVNFNRFIHVVAKMGQYWVGINELPH